MITLKVINKKKLFKLKSNAKFPDINPEKLQEKEVTPTKEIQEIEADIKYDGLTKVVVNPIPENYIDPVGTITIRKNGLYNARMYQNANVDVPPELIDLTVTPKTTEQTFDHKGYEGYDKVVVKAVDSSIDDDIKPENIKSQVRILGVTGTYGENSQTKVVHASKDNDVVVTPDDGIEFLRQVRVLKVDNSIDTNIVPANIRKDINILGVTGTFKGDFKSQSKTTNASKNAKIVVTPDEGYDFLESVVVNKVTNEIDSNIKPENIKSGVKILEVEGTYDPLPTHQEKIVTPTTSQQIITPDDGIQFLDKVTVQAVTSKIDSDIKASNIKQGVNILGVDGTLPEFIAQEKTISPTTSKQNIIPDNGYTALTKVTINAVDNTIDSNIQAENIKNGVNILGIDGTYTGSNVYQSKTATPTFEEQVIVADEGYDALSEVTINPIESEDLEITPTKEIQDFEPSIGKVFNNITVKAVDRNVDANIQPENIRSSVNILGVVGTFSGDGGGELDYIEEVKTGSGSSHTVNSNGVTSNILYLPDGLTCGTSLNYTFGGFGSLLRAPYMDTSHVTTAKYTFVKCYDMTQVPLYDFSNLTDAEGMFSYCDVLPTIPEFNFSKVTTLNKFLDHAGVEVVPSLDIPSVTNLTQTFGNCQNLITIGLLRNGDKVNNVSSTFYASRKIKNFDGIQNLGKGFTTTVRTLKLSDSTALTHDSLVNIFNNLYDLNVRYDVANGGTLINHVVTIGSTNIAKLSSTELEIATNKGWTVN